MSSGKGAISCAVAAAVVVLALLAPGQAARVSAQAPASWRPDVAGARDYARGRRGSVTFSIAVPA